MAVTPNFRILYVLVINGWLTTARVDRTRVWDQGFPMLPRSCRLLGLPDIKFRAIIEWLPNLSWADLIMNIDWRRLQSDSSVA